MCKRNAQGVLNMWSKYTYNCGGGRYSFRMQSALQNDYTFLKSTIDNQKIVEKIKSHFSCDEKMARTVYKLAKKNKMVTSEWHHYLDPQTEKTKKLYFLNAEELFFNEKLDVFFENLGFKKTNQGYILQDAEGFYSENDVTTLVKNNGILKTTITKKTIGVGDWWNGKQDEPTEFSEMEIQEIFSQKPIHHENSTVPTYHFENYQIKIWPIQNGECVAVKKDYKGIEITNETRAKLVKIWKERGE